MDRPYNLRSSHTLEWKRDHTFESTKLRVPRALVPCVCRVLRGLAPHVLSCPTCLVPYVLLCPTCCRALRAPVFHMPRASRASSSVWPRALRFMSLFSLRTLRTLFRTLLTLCPKITFYDLGFPCITVLYFLFICYLLFFWGNLLTKVTTNIVWQ